jgi:hypothetical protein
LGAALRQERGLVSAIQQTMLSPETGGFEPFRRNAAMRSHFTDSLDEADGERVQTAAPEAAVQAVPQQRGEGFGISASSSGRVPTTVEPSADNAEDMNSRGSDKMIKPSQ